MNSLKNRIISGIAVLLMLPQIGFAFPSDLDDVPIKDISTTESTAGMYSSERVHEAFKILKYINAIPEEEAEFEEDEIVTRAYAAAAFGAIASGGRSESGIPDFIDVKAEHEYAAGIAQAQSKGILDKDTDKFYPNKYVLAEDIAVWAIRVLKQDYIIYSQSMFSAAQDLGIFKGVSYSEKGITKGQFLLVLENVLNSDYIEMNGVDSSGSISIKINEDENFMNNVYDIQLQEGILTGYKYSSIYGDSDLEAGKVQINRATFLTDNAIPMEYVGTYVGAYVDTENDNKIVSLWKNEKKTEITKINKEQFKSFLVNEITYYDETSTKRVKINEQIPFIYNNLYYGTLNNDNLKNLLPVCDNVTVIDNDGDGKGDLVKAQKYTHYIIKSVSPMTDTIVFKNNGGTLEITDTTTAEFVFNDQLVESITSLKGDDILTVLEGYRINKTRVFDAILTRDMVEGKISTHSEDENGEFYVIDNVKYYLSDNYLNFTATDSSQEKPTTGTYAQLYVGADGKVVGTKTDNDFSYGYIMSSSYDTGEEVARIKIYTVDGKTQVYLFADKVKVYNEKNINGKKVEKMEAYNLLANAPANDGGKILNDAVAYTLNAEGEIASIAVPIDRTANPHGSLYYPLTLDYDAAKQSPDANTRMYRMLYRQLYTMNASIPILVRPSNDELLNDEKAFEMRTGNYWSVEHYFTPSEAVKVYNANKFYVPDFYVMSGTTSTDLSQGEGKLHMYAIENITDTINEDDMPVKQLSYFENGSLKTVNIAEDVTFVDAGIYCKMDEVSELKKGDIIQFDVNSFGEISIIRVLFDIQNRPSEFGTYSMRSGALVYTEDIQFESLALIHAKVIDSEGSIVLVNSSKDGTNEKYTYPLTLGGSVYGNVYYNIYNSKTKEVTKGSLSEIQTGDEVVMRRYYNHVQDVIIIR